ncbi:hypothetical protein BN7_3751 [Wickerhamomyces ciferrii]|uniref:PRELI/MSF1 domain-containing protein n=1 Tax=Wickerhamomyces ciferrii (strain ATCC 14091 / BCRC 22168 / CBS 111 / JCM 3599 / NBRC 0793 / NRRL Y-1031 F-60-10) TaxID=1206466 RepID=K0KPV2_WICCF|nr:uncharacterized protein BN7_3751 [Wickerhamomyces ciferrii]CCH44192.1 hypothetical protein BN7_3751 [Wickerhamomyces ciferrii]
MVLWYKSTHQYPFNFETVSVAVFNKYPNPYASHVLSVDTIDRELKDGKLYTTRLIKKIGKLPRWVKPFLGRINHSWIVEKTILDPMKQKMQSYTRNLDHTKIIRVEEYTTYESSPSSEDKTDVIYNVKFSSGFKNVIKDRIESYSHTKFQENIKNTKMGMSYVMQKCHERRLLWSKNKVVS